MAAAAFDPAATAFATDGICELRSPAADRPGTVVWNIGSTSTASAVTWPGAAGCAPSWAARPDRWCRVTGTSSPSHRLLSPVGEHDRRQLVAGAAQARDRALVDGHAGGPQPVGVLRLELGGPVGEQRHVVRPGPQQEGAEHAGLAPVEDAQRPLPDLPAVAERAVEHRSAEPLGEAGQLGVPVVHAGGQQDAPGRLPAAVREVEHEARLGPGAGDDLALAHLDGRVGRELGPPGGVQVGGRPAVVAQQAADAVGDAVARATRVDDEGPAPGPAEDQRGAEARGAAADDDAVPGLA